MHEDNGVTLQVKDENGNLLFQDEFFDGFIFDIIAEYSDLEVYPGGPSADDIIDMLTAPGGYTSRYTLQHNHLTLIDSED